MSFGLMVLLIAMVVNIGFLVATKINLQNSVDMAAYAGAAQQARYLTELGKWNYEMRRNYKAMVFDYLLTYSGEFRVDNQFSANEFKKYMTNTNSDGTSVEIRSPWICASLQGGAGDPEGTLTTNWKKICQKATDHSFEPATIALYTAWYALEASRASICNIDPTSQSCLALTQLANNTWNNLGNLTVASQDDINDFKNYDDKDMYNYTVRLLAWMLHDYRHLQSRIRGVHYGDISIGKLKHRYLDTGNTGRWDLMKENPTTNIAIFQNSPMSVAAKVINGFTSTSATTSKLTPDKANLLENDLLKNPVNDAALTTFKNNLFTAISDGAKLYHVTPATFDAPALGTLGSNDMGGGCGGQCPEFKGPYLKVNRHDVGFKGYYTVVPIVGQNIKVPTLAVPPKAIDNFPVGIAKDDRILTYYAVVGTAKTDQIPFNVFFGSGEKTNKDVLMVAVSAARPFGSRIGPFINDQCKDLYDGANQQDCMKNGLDPLYPFKTTSDPVTKSYIPNFSIMENDSARRLGVKMSIGSDEFKMSTGTFPSSSELSEFFGKARKKGSRARDFRFKNPLVTTDTSYSWDDGFTGSTISESSGPKTSSSKFFDNDNTAIHPQGNRNSVWAWDTNLGYTDPTSSDALIPQNQRDNYEGYLDLAQKNNKALYKFANIQDRKTSGLVGNGAYNVYVFKYPSPSTTSTNNWDIQGLTNRTYGSMMEYAFANTMAVSLFEIKRYILPSRSASSSSTLDNDVLNYNYYANTAGSSTPSIYSGATSQIPSGQQGTKLFTDFVTGKEDSKASLESAPFPETYTSWRIGSRGYRVKLVNIQDLVTGNTCPYQNCLSKSYTLDNTDGEPVTVDLSKIFY